MTDFLRHNRLKWMLVDFISTNIAVFLYSVIRYYSESFSQFPSLSLFLSHTPVIMEQIMFPLLMLFLYWLCGTYADTVHKSRVSLFLSTAGVSLAGALIFFIIALIDDTDSDRIKSYLLILSLAAILFVCLYSTRMILLSSVRRKISDGDFALSAVVCGPHDSAVRLAEKLMSDRRETGLNVSGILATDNESTRFGGQTSVFTFEDIDSLAARNDISVFVLTRDCDDSDRIINRLLMSDKQVLIEPSLTRKPYERAKVTSVSGEPLIDASNPGISAATLNIKRSIDVVGAVIGLLFSAPIIAVAAIIIKNDSKGPVFFRQSRVGKNFRPFTIYKLRTMVVNAETEGPALASHDDPRVTGPGHFLRKYRIDELPQFWNILKGEMSLVGPRPEREFYLKELISRSPHYIRLLRLTPGLTSWGMVKYGYASDIEAMIERSHFDMLYLDNLSLLNDFKIILYTIRTVFTGKGI